MEIAASMKNFHHIKSMYFRNINSGYLFAKEKRKMSMFYSNPFLKPSTVNCSYFQKIIASNFWWKQVAFSGLRHVKCWKLFKRKFQGTWCSWAEIRSNTSPGSFEIAWIWELWELKFAFRRRDIFPREFYTPRYKEKISTYKTQLPSNCTKNEK